ncbi:MAG: hypothetical protein ACK4I8_12050, partial [Armatimonadota bacterium]
DLIGDFLDLFKGSDGFCLGHFFSPKKSLVQGKWAFRQVGRWAGRQVGKWADEQVGSSADGQMGRSAVRQIGRWVDR